MSTIWYWLRWWLTPRLATEEPRHCPDFWLARGVGLTDLERAVLRMSAGLQAFQRQLVEAFTPVMAAAAQTFTDLARAFAPLADQLGSPHRATIHAPTAAQVAAELGYRSVITGGEVRRLDEFLATREADQRRGR